MQIVKNSSEIITNISNKTNNNQITSEAGVYSIPGNM